MSAAKVRLLPALITTMGVILSLKAVAAAEEAAQSAAGETPQASPQRPAASAPAEPTGSAAPPAASAAAASTCPPPSFADQAGLSQSEVRVLQSLGERRRILDQREAALADQTALLEAAEKRVDERLAELKRLEANVQTLLGQLDEAQEERVRSLVDVYQRMRAKDAAAVFNGLEEDVLIAVASRMRQQNLAEILGQMAPDRARRLTQLLLEQSRPPATAAELGQAPPRS